MTTSTSTNGMKPVFHKVLGREIPTTGSGTVRLGWPLVQPGTLALIEQGVHGPCRLTLGQAVDQLAEHARSTKFKFSPVK